MKIFKIIYYIFLSCLAAIALLLVVSIFPITGNIKFLVVQSGSMEPAIKLGSVVVVKPAHSTGSGQANDYKIGDMITFGKISRTETPVTHRISDIKTENGQTVYITKGDANNAPDSKTTPQKEVVGKVLLDIPYLGYVLSFAKKPLGFLAIIVIPAAMIIFDEAKKIFGEIKKTREKKKAQEETTNL